MEPANSFIAMWFIPTVVVWELMEAFRLMDMTFFQTEQILGLSLGERTLYQRNIAAECVTSSAMEPLSAFTHISTKFTLVHYILLLLWQQKFILKIYPSLHFITFYPKIKDLIAILACARMRRCAACKE